jgi:hypothetical protein
MARANCIKACFLQLLPTHLVHSGPKQARYENGLLGDRGDLETAREFREQARRGGIAEAANQLEIFLRRGTGSKSGYCFFSYSESEAATVWDLHAKVRELWRIAD